MRGSSSLLSPRAQYLHERAHFVRRAPPADTNLSCAAWPRSLRVPRRGASHLRDHRERRSFARPLAVASRLIRVHFPHPLKQILRVGLLNVRRLGSTAVTLLWSPWSGTHG